MVEDEIRDSVEVVHQYLTKYCFQKLVEYCCDVKDVQLGDKNVFNPPLLEQLIGKNEFFTPIHIDRKKL